MAVQFPRRASLLVIPVQETQYDIYGDIVAVGQHNAIDLSDMHFVFEIGQSDVSTPNTLRVRIYNLKDETVNLIKTASSPTTSEFATVILNAGYAADEDFGTIFKGNIKQVRTGRENATDTYTEILAADGDQAIAFTLLNQSIAAGSKIKDRLAAAEKALAENHVTMGYAPALGDVGLPRGKVLFGLAKALLDDEADNAACRWSVQDGKVQFVPLTGYVPGDVIVLTSNTGLIGLPEQTQEGIRARCLLNPNIVVGRRVKIDNKSVQQQPINLDYTAINFFPSIAADGVYRAIVVEHEGDTRGEPWYTNLVLLKIDPTVPADVSVAASG